MIPNVYDELPRRLYGFNRDLIKRAIIMRCYSAEDLDPWLVHVIRTELNAMMLEEGMKYGLRA